MSIKTREEWLLKATEILRVRLFTVKGTSLPEVKVSVGWPAGARPSAKMRVLGQIWGADATDDRKAQIFISPQVDKPIDALAVLAHELVHACTPGDGHGDKFKALATSIGLVGPMRATVPNKDLQHKLALLAQFLGPYPHSAINIADRPAPQKTRMIKVICSQATTGGDAPDPYAVRMTDKWVKVGLPICPCHKVPMQVVGAE